MLMGSIVLFHSFSVLGHLYESVVDKSVGEDETDLDPVQSERVLGDSLV